MATKNHNPLHSLNAEPDPLEVELARTLADYLDGWVEREFKDPRESFSRSSRLTSKIGPELDTLWAVGVIVDGQPSREEFGEFRLLRLIGRGGMGVVHEAYQTSLNRRVALKVLPPDLLADPRAVERFHREAQAAASLHHPNIVPVYSMGVEDGIPYYAMELVFGETLYQLERRLQSTVLKGNTPGQAATHVVFNFHESNSPNSEHHPAAAVKEAPDRAAESLSGDTSEKEPDDTAADEPSSAGLDAAYCKRVAGIFIGVTEGLQHAHSHGVVHRDLKPANLILDSNGHLRILDFGLAWVEGQSHLTLPKQRPGTPPYMSPEQAQGRTDVFGPATDIYSLGATLYEMLVWRPPFRGRTHQETFRLLTTSEAPALRRLNPNVPRDLETIVMKCLLKDPRERYATAEALGRDLCRLVAGEPIEAKPLPLSVRLARRAWKHRTRIAEAAGALSLLLTLALIVFFIGKNAREERDRVRKSNLEDAAINLSVSEVASRPGSLWLCGDNTFAFNPNESHPVPEDSNDGETDILYNASASVFETGPVPVPMEPEPLRAAVRQLHDVLRTHSDDPIPHYYLARAALIEGDPGQALERLRVSLTLDPICIPALSLRATLLESRNDPGAGAALAALEKAANLPGKEWGLALHKIQKAEMARDWKTAATAYDELRDGWKSADEPYAGANLEALPGEGMARLRAGQLGEAYAAFALCGERCPRSIEPNLLKARVCFAEGKDGEAEKILGGIYKRLPSDSTAALIAGVCRDMGRLNCALAWCDRMGSEDPRQVRLQAEILSRRGKDNEKALNAAQRAVDLEPKSCDARILLGNVLLQQRKFSEAREVFEQARGMAPDDSRTLIAQGICLELDSKLPEAKEYFQRAIERGHHPYLSDAHYSLARVWEKLGHPNDAVRSYERALEVDPGNALAHNNLGSLLYRQKDVEGALKRFERAVDLAPLLGVAHYNLALAYQKMRLFGEAAAEYRMAIKLGVQDAMVYANLAPCLQWLRTKPSIAEAIEYYAKAVNLDREVPLYSFNQGSGYLWLGDLSMSLKCYADAARLVPGSAVARSEHGVALLRVGRVEEAHTELQAAIRLNPNYYFARYNMAELLLGSSLLPLAREELPEMIRGLEGAANPGASSRVIPWLLERCRQELAPRIASYASIDDLIEGVQPLVPEGDSCQYFPGRSEPSPELEWTEVSFEESGWVSGSGPFGYPADAGITTHLQDMNGGYSTLYVRRVFSVEDPLRIEKLVLSVRIDDGFVAYLNGREVCRYGAGNEGERQPYDAKANREETERWAALDFALDPGRLQRGTNVLAVQGINSGVNDTDFAFSTVLGVVFKLDDEKRSSLEASLRAFDEQAEDQGKDAQKLSTYFKGRLLQSAGRFLEAEAWFRQVTAMDTSRSEPFLRRAECLQMTGETGMAEKILRGGLDAEDLQGRDALLESWFRLVLLDPGRSPENVLAIFPAEQPGTKHLSPYVFPDRQSDLKWVLTSLAATNALRINCGGADFFDDEGNSWSQDRFFLAGFPAHVRELSTENPTLAEKCLYKTERQFHEQQPIIEAYRIPLPRGVYRITLHFVDSDPSQPAGRRFDVLLEGDTVLPDYEPIKAGFGFPIEEGIGDITVRDGALDIGLVRSLGRPQLCGIVIVRV